MVGACALGSSVRLALRPGPANLYGKLGAAGTGDAAIRDRRDSISCAPKMRPNRRSGRSSSLMRTGMRTVFPSLVECRTGGVSAVECSRAGAVRDHWEHIGFDADIQVILDVGPRLCMMVVWMMVR